ncbi:MAG: hypothetical protein Q8S53_06870 [Brevundimonas sp.]|uniref:hypothetical protein n=1 Tax=Brevundimonas sp. TaxID=1871086 RepID=UPI0027376004|nr:hypothetical protein [Brevundimonas sp.]MDP3378070.1 hypothetical protein [Brevundimonas sp.]
MKTAIAAAVCAVLCSAGQAAAQDSDWDFFEDPARELTQAAVQYAGGQTIAAQCLQGGLTLVITGLPEGTEMLRMSATRADGRSADQIWLPLAEAGTYRSTSPGREARFMRGGGAYDIRTTESAPASVSATFDLPSLSANLDRVLTACGWALEDDRDLLPEATVTIDPPGRRYQAPPYRPPPVPEREVSCIVRNMQLRDCRADHPPYANTGRARSLIRFIGGSLVYALPGTDPAAAEGSVYRVIANNQVLIMVNR